MCDTCGCGQPGEAVTFRKPGDHRSGHPHDHHHHHGHDQDHEPPHDHDHEHGSRQLAVEQDVLQQNNLLAERNRGWFAAKGILALNLVSSPGSGKTTLLERTIADLGAEFAVSVVEGDQQTLNDADRIAATGAPVIQVNTGHGCHLDAAMIRRAVDELDPAEKSVVMIENVGNLVCPALFDLGESAKVVIISVTEGDDKPLKYPTMFAASDLCLVNKIDLTPYVDFDLDRCEEAARSVNPKLEFCRLSATTGEGMDRWYDWLRARREA
ncbi:MAG: hydrogenase nickel incorporation protein HypB [bacterium]|nr:hydrogenase nickel incorporation protein HypB [bacterium]